MYSFAAIAANNLGLLKVLLASQYLQSIVMPEKKEKVPAPRMYRILDEYPGLDLEKTKERFECLSVFFADLLDDYVQKVLDKYGSENDYMDKNDHMKEMLLHDPYVRDLLTRSLVYPSFKFEDEDFSAPLQTDAVQLELDL